MNLPPCSVLRAAVIFCRRYLSHSSSTTSSNQIQILDEQKKEKVDGSMAILVDGEETDEKTIEMGLTARRKTSKTVHK